MLALLLLLAAPAAADTVSLTNGVKLEGIVSAQDAEGVTLEVAEGGSVFLDSASVVAVALDAAGRARLREEWRRQKAADDAARREEAGRPPEAPKPAPPAEDAKTSITIVNNIVVNAVRLPDEEPPFLFAFPARFPPGQRANVPLAPFGMPVNKRFDIPILRDGGLIGAPSRR